MKYFHQDIPPFAAFRGWLDISNILLNLWLWSIGNSPWTVLGASQQMQYISRIIRTHYNDVRMSTIASQITGLTIVYLIIYPHTVRRKHQSSASQAFARNSPGTGDIPAQRASNTGNVSIWWRHHALVALCCVWCFSSCQLSLPLALTVTSLALGVVWLSQWYRCLWDECYWTSVVRILATSHLLSR